MSMAVDNWGMEDVVLMLLGCDCSRWRYGGRGNSAEGRWADRLGILGKLQEGST